MTLATATSSDPERVLIDMTADPLPDDPQSRSLIAAYYRQTVLDAVLSRAPGFSAPRFDRRMALAEALWERAPFEAAPARPLPEIDAADATLARFLDVSQGHHCPVVIRGFGADSTAVKSWSAAGLAERVGPLDITAVEMNRIPQPGELDVRYPLHDLQFADFVRRMGDEPLYLHNSETLIAACPELLDELHLDRVRTALCDPSETWDPIFSASLFIGTGNVYSGLHNAPGGNFFLQVTGRKTWTFVHPALSPYLAVRTAKPFNHARSAYGTFHTAGPDSPIHRLPRYTVTLEPGDLLYNAPWWWHEVLNTGETIGCAMRYVAPPLRRSPTWHNHRLFAGLSVWPMLWTASMVDFARHRVAEALGRGRSGTLRAMVSRRVDRTVNRARKQST